MNRFNDGFSNNSYEDLLNEYAGDSLGKSTKKPSTEPTKKAVNEPVKKYSPARESAKQESTVAKPLEEPVFNIDVSRKKKAEDFSLNRGTVANFEDTYSTSTPKKSQPTASNTMEFSARKTPLNKRYPSAVENKAEDSASQGNSAQDVSGFELFVGNAIRKIQGKKKIQTNNREDFSNGTQPKVKITKDNFIPLLNKTFTENKNIFIIFACCLVMSILLSSIALSCINDVLAINRDGEETIEVVLPNDADTSDALKALDDAGLIKNTVFCNLFLTIMGESDEGYLPGVYYFTDDLGVEKMIDRFKTSSTRGAMISVTIPEGYTIDQIFARLEKNNICTAESLYKTIDSIDFSEEYSFIAKIENPDERYHQLEGYMFPATYEFEQGADPATVIRKFLNAFNSRWTEEYAAKATELGMSTDDIIRLASIIEKEGADHDQFGLVSSVLHNRLNNGVYLKLDCDSTKDYVINTVSQRVTSISKINAFIKAYDTYECAGLPAGAICNPGVAAIEAALNPDKTQYYYFRHDKNGKIYMAETLRQHEANGRTVASVNAEE